MAPTREDFTTSTTDDFSHNLTAGSSRIVLLCVQYEESENTLSPTYGGQAMSEVTGSPVANTATSTNEVVHWFYLLETNLPSDGANTVSVGATPTGRHFAAFTYSGAEQVEPGDFSSDVGTTDMTADVTTDTDSSIILSAAVNNAGNSNRLTDTSYGTGQTELWAANGSTSADTVFGTEETLTTAGTDTQTITNPFSDNMAMGSIFIAPASTGGGGGTGSLPLLTAPAIGA